MTRGRDADGATGPPRVFTISPHRPFVDVLAGGLLSEYAGAPERLADVRLLLPTRRAVRAVIEAFLRLSGGRTVLLPRLTALGDLDEEDLGVQDLGAEGDAAAALDLAPAISGLRRQALLARLILKIPGRADTADQALRLAAELARLLDQVATERLSLADLDRLVPADLAEHWQITLGFLEILTRAWPAILAEEGCIDGAEHRNRLLERQARVWSDNPPDTPVIAAGSTGSIPATADFLNVIAHLPRGAVILPGLDRWLDAAAWRELEPHHPQYGMARLLDRLGADRHRVGEWPGAWDAAPSNKTVGEGGSATPPAKSGPHPRFQMLSIALRPAAVTGAPPDAGGVDLARAVQGVRRIDCATPDDEALVIALALREALETPGRRGALVTPDRGLARRVRAELARWDIRIDDSAGLPLAETPPGGLLRLAARMISEGYAPVHLLSVLKHPLVGLGMAPTAVRQAARRLEIAILRAPRPAPGIDGLRAALDQAGPGDAADLANLLDRVARAAAALQNLMIQTTADLPGLARAHIAMVEALAATDETMGAARLWAGDAGEAAAAFMADVVDAGDALGALRPREYPAALDGLMAGRGVRPRYGGHPRLAIWGLLEARLQQSDLMILGGLNEGVWPPDPRPSPWMSRPMMGRFGLPLPERRIGLTAHDFVQGMMAPEVLITRSGRVDGAPTVPARWLLRLDNLIGEARLGDPAPLAWSRSLDAPEALVAAKRPLPRPAPGRRPRGLSVTAVETWVRDPYAIFARYILNLEPLDPIDADPGAAEKGILIHEILERFVAGHSGDLPADAEAQLLALGGQVFDDRAVPPGQRAFWWPRFRRIADWFVANERLRRAAGIAPVAREVTGRHRLELPGGDGFELSATADRLDRDAAGGLVIVDYKTGTAPSWAMAEVGFSPQLPLEAAIAQAGGFEGIPATPVAMLNYLRLTGGRRPGEDRRRAADDLAAEALAGLARRAARFAQEVTPYPPRLRPMYENQDGPYDHLARVRAWMAMEGAGGGGSEGGGPDGGSG